jgi:nicotinamidase-related amidase
MSESNTSPATLAEPVIPHLGLILIDLQPPFISMFPQGQSVLHRCRFAYRVAHAFGLPILFTEQNPDKLGITDATLLSEAGASTYQRIGKQSFSAFQSDAVHKWIKEHDLSHLLLVGLETHICLYLSALDATEMELDVTVLSDCIGGRMPEQDATVFAALRAAGVHTLPSETVFYSLLGSADHPQFRTLSRLVRDASQAPSL